MWQNIDSFAGIIYTSLGYDFSSRKIVSFLKTNNNKKLKTKNELYIYLASLGKTSILKSIIDYLTHGCLGSD